MVLGVGKRRDAADHPGVASRAESREPRANFVLLSALVFVLALVLGSVRPAVAAGPLGTVVPSLVVAAEPEWSERRTENLLLRFDPDDAVAVEWYAKFVEETYRGVVDVFGFAPRPGIVVTFYSDQQSYGEVNPLAGREESILAHARPADREVGLALWRLEKQSEALRRDAVRHELTHVVLGEMSNNRLPIGFQEGIAQYLEQDPEQRQKLARLLRRGQEAGQLLSFVDLNRQRPFLARAGTAYPQSYSMVVFLAERYGFGRVVELVRATDDADNLDRAARVAFGKPLAELEQEWREFLPSFLDGGWARNDLDLWDLAEPRQMMGEGKYAEAREPLERAARLFEGLGRADKLEQARVEQRRAAAAVQAAELGQRGSTALEGHDYPAAVELLGQAEAFWTSVGDGARVQATVAARDEARRGVEATDALDRARAALDNWRLTEATERAQEAGRTFVILDDAGRAAEANTVLDGVEETRTRLGMAAVGGGAIGLAAVGLTWAARRRPRPITPASAAAGLSRERDWSL